MERACYQKNYLSLAYTLKLVTHGEFSCLYTLRSTTTGTDFDQVVFSRFNLKIRIFGEPVIPNKQEKLRKKFSVMFMIFLYTIFTRNDSRRIANNPEVYVSIPRGHFARFYVTKAVTMKIRSASIYIYPSTPKVKAIGSSQTSVNL
jgi:hypothetical protein